MEFVLVLIWLLWLSLVTNAWYVVLIPFWIGTAAGFYHKTFKYPVIGLVASFVLSWVIVIVAVLTARFS